MKTWYAIILIGVFSASILMYVLLSADLKCDETNQVLKNACNLTIFEMDSFLIITITIIIILTFVYTKASRDQEKSVLR